ncbi:MAG: hypothetical protein JWN72_2199, partial [Thermoleophilia bacterium]|nr:hypothetical protein [Thermoleophilia bacterium]
MRPPSPAPTPTELALIRDDPRMYRLRFATWIVAALAAFTVWLVLSTAWFVHEADRVRGTVVDKYEHPRRGATERPEFTYVVDGRTYRARADVGDPRIDIGDRVDVLVDPGDARDARLATSGSVWKAPIITGSVTGLVALFILGVRRLVQALLLRRIRRDATSPS